MFFSMMLLTTLTGLLPRTDCVSRARKRDQLAGVLLDLNLLHTVSLVLVSQGVRTATSLERFVPPVAKIYPLLSRVLFL